MILDKLLEIYYEKNQNLEKIEEIIEKIQSKYTIKDKANKINKDPLFKELGNIIKTEFGFKKVSVSVNIDQDESVNAFCIPIKQSLFGQYAAAYTISNKGIKYKPEANAHTIFIFTKAILFNIGMTPKELTAILLHEIGHNFMDAVMPLEAPILFLTDYFIINIKTIDRLKHNKPVEDIYKEGKSLVDKSVKFLHCFALCLPFINYMAGLIAHKTNIILTIEGIITGLFGYTNEKFADNFAANYGYGPELASGLAKMDNSVANPSFWIYKIPILGKLIHNMLDLFVLIIGNMMIEPHPESIHRMNNTINSLKYEIENNPCLDNDTKKEILQQIKETEKIEDEYLKDINSNGYSLIKISYIHIINAIFKNGDILSKLIPLLNIEKAYDKIIGKKEE